MILIINILRNFSFLLFSFLQYSILIHRKEFSKIVATKISRVIKSLNFCCVSCYESKITASKMSAVQRNDILLDVLKTSSQDCIREWHNPEMLKHVRRALLNVLVYARPDASRCSQLLGDRLPRRVTT